MPIYEYVCGACGNSHEALQKISDAPLTDCPACGQSSLKKKVSAPAFDRLERNTRNSDKRRRIRFIFGNLFVETRYGIAWRLSATKSKRH